MSKKVNLADKEAVRLLLEEVIVEKEVDNDKGIGQIQTESGQGSPID